MTKLTIRVQPGARRAGITGRLADGTWKVAVTAPPEKGRANAAVAEVLASVLGLRSRQVRIEAGAAARTKVVAIEGLEADEVERRIALRVAADAKGRRERGR